MNDEHTKYKALVKLMKAFMFSDIGDFIDMNVDIAFLTKLLHSHAYALSLALTETLGEVQSILMKNYAKQLLMMLDALELNLRDVTSYITSLKKAGLVKEAKVRALSSKEIEFIVKGCTLAPYTHRLVINRGLSGKMLCPLAAIAMVILALERGWKPDRELFKYVRFMRELSLFTEDGTRTKFEVVSV